MQRAIVVGVLRSAVVLALVCAGPALAATNEGPEHGSGRASTARDEGRGNGYARGLRERPSRGGRDHGARWVPEFDPATAGAIAVIIAGGGVLVARRRERK